MRPLDIILSNEKHATIDIDPEQGIIIFPTNGEKLNLDEIHLLSSIAFIYLGTHQKDIILEPKEIVRLGLNFYNAFHKNYEGAKSFKEMSLEEFNKIIAYYNGRKK